MPAQNTNIQQPSIKGFNYGIDLISGSTKGSGGEFGRHLTSVRITSSIYSMWTNVALTMNVDIDEIVMNSIFGQDMLNMTIVWSGEENKEQEKTEIPLLYIQADNNLIPKDVIQSSLKQQDLQPMTFQCIPLHSVKTLTTFANKVYLFGPDINSAQPPLQVLQQLLSDIGITNTEIDKKGMNKNRTIYQIVIPPMTLRQAIEYINSYYNFYEGPFFVFCDYTGKLVMWSLSERLKRDAKLTITHLATNTLDSKKIDDIIRKPVEDGKNFTTRDAVSTVYHSNANILTYGYINTFMTHPYNDLYCMIISNIDQVDKKFSVKPHSNSRMFYQDALTQVKRYYNNNIGSDYDPTNLTTSIASNIKKMTTISTVLRRNIRIQNILQSVGEPASFIPMTMEYKKYKGNYIIDTADIVFDKTANNNWQCTCTLIMSRTSMFPEREDMEIR